MNTIIRSLEKRGAQFLNNIKKQVKNGSFNKSFKVFIIVIAVVTVTYFFWDNAFRSTDQNNPASQGSPSFLANIWGAIDNSFANMFAPEDDNLLAEISSEREVKSSNENITASSFVFLDKTSAYARGVIIKSGSNFIPKREITLFFSSPSEKITSSMVLSDEHGSFNYVYNVPTEAERGVHYFWAEDKIAGHITDRVRYLILSVADKNISQQEIAEILSRNPAENNNESTSNTEKLPLALPRECSFADEGQTSQSKQVILNEIAWMGSTADANEEWIELKNVSSSPVNISGWWLIDKAEQIKIVFPNNTIIPAGRFFLLERTDDNSVPNVRADMTYKGTLSNDEEGLRILNPDCQIEDEALASPKWPAGEATSRKTMERKNNLSLWHTSIFVNGTPKQENSTGDYAQSNHPAGVSTSTAVLPTPQTNQPAKLLISEVQITGGTGKTHNDFIELYNPNNFPVNLNDYRLVRRTENGISDIGIKSWVGDVFIPANGFYLWANSDYTDIFIPPDATTTATISNNNGIAIRFGPVNAGTIIDSIGWGEAQNIFVEGLVFPTNPEANQSIQRKLQNDVFVDTNNNAEDFELQNCPSPKNYLGNCAPARIDPSVSSIEVTALVSWTAFAGTVKISDDKGDLWSGQGDASQSKITLKNPEQEHKLYFEAIDNNGRSAGKQRVFLMTFQRGSVTPVNTAPTHQIILVPV